MSVTAVSKDKKRWHSFTETLTAVLLRLEKELIEAKVQASVNTGRSLGLELHV